MVKDEKKIKKQQKLAKFLAKQNRPASTALKVEKMLNSSTGYDPEATERGWNEFWQSNGFFRPEFNEDVLCFCDLKVDYSAVTDRISSEILSQNASEGFNSVENSAKVSWTVTQPPDQEVQRFAEQEILLGNNRSHSSESPLLPGTPNSNYRCNPNGPEKTTHIECEKSKRTEYSGYSETNQANLINDSNLHSKSFSNQTAFLLQPSPKRETDLSQEGSTRCDIPQAPGFCSKCGQKARKINGIPYVIPLPPPNITGKLHIGHALMLSIQDALARYYRMHGRPVLFLPGTDHAGIATQTVVEKKIARYTTRHALGRVKFIQEVEKWRDTHGGIIYDQMQRLGASFDLSRKRFTLDTGYSASVVDAFNVLYKAKKIYRDSKIVSYSAKLQTTLSDLEVVSKEVVPFEKISVDDGVYTFGVMHYIRYPIVPLKYHIDSEEYENRLMVDFIDMPTAHAPDTERLSKLSIGGKNSNSASYPLDHTNLSQSERPPNNNARMGRFSTAFQTLGKVGQSQSSALNPSDSNDSPAPTQSNIGNSSQTLVPFVDCESPLFKIGNISNDSDVVSSTGTFGGITNNPPLEKDTYYIGDLKDLPFIEIGTTRIETVLGDTAICLNPKDKRKPLLENCFAINPLTRKLIPIVYDDFCDIEFGSGALKVTPAHDFNDFDIGKRNKLHQIMILDNQNKIILNDILKGLEGLCECPDRSNTGSKRFQNGTVPNEIHNVSEELCEGADRFGGSLKRSQSEIERAAPQKNSTTNMNKTNDNAALEHQTDEFMIDSASSKPLHVCEDGLIGELNESIVSANHDEHEKIPSYSTHTPLIALREIYEMSLMPLAGVRRFEARIQILKYFKTMGLFTREEGHSLTLPICSRSGDIVEPTIKKQWFMDCTQAAQRVLELDCLKIHPAEAYKTWRNWLFNIKDWCLSRQLWYGHRVPAFRFFCGDKRIGWVVGSSMLDLHRAAIQEITKEDSEARPSDATQTKLAAKDGSVSANTEKITDLPALDKRNINNLTKDSGTDETEPLNISNDGASGVYASIQGVSTCISNTGDSHSNKKIVGQLVDSKAGNPSKNQHIFAFTHNNQRIQALCDKTYPELPSFSTFEFQNKIYSLYQDEDVLDTWFSSSLWPFATVGWQSSSSSLNIGTRDAHTNIKSSLKDFDSVDANPAEKASVEIPLRGIDLKSRKTESSLSGYNLFSANPAENLNVESLNLTSQITSSDLQKYFPASVLETGYDILFFWVARMVMMSLELTGQAPFKEILLHGIIRDAHGKKMSKSLGNVIDPLYIIDGIKLHDMDEILVESHENGYISKDELKRAMDAQKKDFPDGIMQCGADALRFSLCSYFCNMKDINLDIKRVFGYRKLCNKIYNSYKFFENFSKFQSCTPSRFESQPKKATDLGANTCSEHSKGLQSESGHRSNRNSITDMCPGHSKGHILESGHGSEKCVESASPDESALHVSVRKNVQTRDVSALCLQTHDRTTLCPILHNDEDFTMKIHDSPLHIFWIIQKRSDCLKSYKQNFESYNFMQATQVIHNYFLTEFCDVFIEVLKKTTSKYNEALFLAIFKDILAMFSPFMPFVTEEIYQKIRKPQDPPSICVLDFPEVMSVTEFIYFNLHENNALDDLLGNKRVSEMVPVSKISYTRTTHGSLLESNHESNNGDGFLVPMEERGDIKNNPFIKMDRIQNSRNGTRKDNLVLIDRFCRVENQVDSADQSDTENKKESEKNGTSYDEPTYKEKNQVRSVDVSDMENQNNHKLNSSSSVNHFSELIDQVSSVHQPDTENQNNHKHNRSSFVNHFSELKNQDTSKHNMFKAEGSLLNHKLIDLVEGDSDTGCLKSVKSTTHQKHCNNTSNSDGSSIQDSVIKNAVEKFEIILDLIKNIRSLCEVNKLRKFTLFIGSKDDQILFYLQRMLKNITQIRISDRIKTEIYGCSHGIHFGIME